MDRTVKDKRNCAVCGGSASELLFQQQFSEISESGLLAGYDVVVCRVCGFCFAENLPSQDAFDVYYREMSKYEHQDRSGEASEFEVRQFPVLAHFIEMHLPSKQARILEIGCANGGLLNALKQVGYPNVLGVDPSPICARNAERLYQIKVLTSAVSDLKPELGPFDFIILVAVLEHIRDLENTLRTIGALLSPGGQVYVEVPDVTQFAMSPDAPFQEFSIEHINYFTPASLTNLMGRYGFRAIFSEQTYYDQTDTHIGYAARIVFGKIEAMIDFRKDPSGETALRKYISASQKVENRIHETVRELIASQRPLVVWGVGTHTQRLLATGGLGEANISAFVDSNPNYAGKKLNDVPILLPTEIGNAGECILISSRIFQSEILQQIRLVLKLENEVITLYEE